MRIAVGCPVRNRGWILPSWFDHVERAFEALGVEPMYTFVVGSSEDRTLEIIEQRAPKALVAHTEEQLLPESSTRWTLPRFHELVTARNKLLINVRALGPDLFLSLDSDILINETTVPNLIETLEAHPNWAAVGGKLYMTPTGKHTPSYAFNKPAGGLVREEAEGCFRVEIIMALKLMQPEAYYVDYRYSEKGEDVAWSLDCAKSGLILGWDGRVANKHVMLNRQLYETDPRVGY